MAMISSRMYTAIIVDCAEADMYDRSNTLEVVRVKAAEVFSIGGYEVDDLEIRNADEAFNDRQKSCFGSGEHLVFQVFARTTLITAE